MKAFYRDPNTGWLESTRDGPWEPIFTNQSPIIVVPLNPVFLDGEIWWEIEFKGDPEGQSLLRVYRWDWEGDASLMLREAMYAAQISAAAS